MSGCKHNQGASCTVCAMIQAVMTEPEEIHQCALCSESTTEPTWIGLFPICEACRK